jgi:hypothetical protein
MAKSVKVLDLTARLHHASLLFLVVARPETKLHFFGYRLRELCGQPKFARTTYGVEI